MNTNFEEKREKFKLLASRGLSKKQMAKDIGMSYIYFITFLNGKNDAKTFKYKIDNYFKLDRIDEFLK